MKYGYGVTEEFLQRLVLDVLTRRDPTGPLIAVLTQGVLTEDQREEIRGFVADELIETGLADDHEPNARGLLLESAIDWLGTR